MDETVEYQEILDLLEGFERAMADLFRELARSYPERRDLWEGLAQEEERHAELVAMLAQNHPDICILPDTEHRELVARIHTTLEAVGALQADAVAGREPLEHILDRVVNLEVSSAEMQINRLVMEHRYVPAIDRLVAEIDDDEWHEKLLCE